MFVYELSLFEQHVYVLSVILAFWSCIKVMTKLYVR